MCGRAGGYLFYDSTRPRAASELRDDITVIGMPLTEICNAVYSDPRQRQLFKNIMYVGALTALLDMDFGVFDKLIADQYRGKDKLIGANLNALKLGYNRAKAELPCPIGLRVERSDGVGQRIFVERQQRLRPRRRLWRCNGRRVVPDHPVDVGHRVVQQLLPQVPHRRR